MKIENFENACEEYIELDEEKKLDNYAMIELMLERICDDFQGDIFSEKVKGIFEFCVERLDQKKKFYSLLVDENDHNFKKLDFVFKYSIVVIHSKDQNLKNQYNSLKKNSARIFKENSLPKIFKSSSEANQLEESELDQALSIQKLSSIRKIILPIYSTISN